MTNNIIWILFGFIVYPHLIHCKTCLEDPTQSSCTDYHLPSTNISSDLEMACSMMPTMSGCSVRRLCWNYPTSQFCNSFSVLIAACKYMPKMMGCTNYKNLCTVNNTVVKDCFLPTLTIPIDSELKSKVHSICDQMEMSGCDECKGNSDCDVLAIYSSLCLQMPGMSECTYWSVYCKQVPAWSICSVPKPNKTCVEDPSQQSCADFHLPNSTILADIEMACSMMPNMPGCTIHRLCPNYQTDKYCKPFSVLIDTCEYMGGMMGCTTFRHLCLVNNTVVKDCKTPALHLPTGPKLKEQITSICDDMVMDGCDTCKEKDCDALTVYSSLCLQMPNMQQCGQWNSICALIPSWSICSGSDVDQPPQMRMYFHLGFADYVLLKEWVPRTAFEYWMALLAIFLVSFFGEGLKATRTIMEFKWRSREISSPGYAVLANDNEIKPLMNIPKGKHGESRKVIKFQPFSPKIDFSRAMLRILEVTIHYLLMLIAMTFNVGMFLAVILGIGLGHLFFGRFSSIASVEGEDCH